MKNPHAATKTQHGQNEWINQCQNKTRWSPSFLQSLQLKYPAPILSVGFPGSSAGKESACNAGDPGSIPGSGSSPREGLLTPLFLGFPGGSDSKASTCNVGDLGSTPGLGKSPGGGHGDPLQYSCLESPHRQRNLVGYSLWGHKELDMTETKHILSAPTWHSFTFAISYIV